MKTDILDSADPLTSSEMPPLAPASPASAPRRRLRLALPVSLGVVALLSSLLIAAVNYHPHPKHDAVPSSTADDDQKPWDTLGTVDVKGGMTMLYPLQPGRVRGIEAKENVPVEKGDPLFCLDDFMQQQKVREAKAAVELAQEQVKLAESKLAVLDGQIATQSEAIEDAKFKVKRAFNFYDQKRRYQDKKLVNETEVEDAKLQWEQAKLGVRVEEKKRDAMKAGRDEAVHYAAVARKDVALKQAFVVEAEKAVAECVVRAPVKGTPLQINVSVGQVLGPNPSEPAIAFAADLPLLVRAEVEQEFAERVLRYQSVDIEDHVTGKSCAHGKVVSIAHWYARRRTLTPTMIPAANDPRTLECIVQIDEKSPRVRIGQRVRVRFRK